LRRAARIAVGALIELGRRAIWFYGVIRISLCVGDWGSSLCTLRALIFRQFHDFETMRKNT
jgi:hypothetical protein